MPVSPHKTEALTLLSATLRNISTTISREDWTQQDVSADTRCASSQTNSVLTSAQYKASSTRATSTAMGNTTFAGIKS